MDGTGNPLITVGNAILAANGSLLGTGSNGDGTLELVTGNAAYDSRGNTIWYNGGVDGLIAVADFDLDGYPEVLYADETQIRFFSGLDGTVKYASGSHASYTILETPIVADVDNDDQVEIVLGHCNGNASIGSLTVYGDADDTWPPGRKIWNQHAYYINNVDDVGGIPSTNTSNWPTYNSFRSGDVGPPAR